MSEIQHAYRRLLERAAAAGFVPPGGLTPREVREPLADALHNRAAQEESRIAELTELVEQCAYAEQGTEEHRALALRLCDAVTNMIPEPPPPKAPRRSFNWSWLPFVLLVPLAIVLAILIIISAGSFSFGGFGTFGSSTGATSNAAQVSPTTNSIWQSNAASERQRVLACKGNWSSTPRDVTWETLSIDQTLRADSLSPEINSVPGSTFFDTNTGTDGVFDNADDPFAPPLGWMHRTFVFDRVDANYQILRAPLQLKLADGKQYADGETYRVRVKVDARMRTPIAVPSPGPDAIVTSYEATPNTAIRFVRDRGDGLHAIVSPGSIIDLSYECSVHRQQYENAPLPATPFVPKPITLPANVRADAQQVIDAIGELPQPTYEQTVRRLQAYFAGFSVAPIETSEHRGNQYLTIALARKGVCRHRARTFFITANAVGVPTRLIENRCHSFCEVQLPDGSWRRLEFRLGDEDGPPGLRSNQLARSGPSSLGLMLAMVVLPFALVGLLMFGLWRARRSASMELGMLGQRRQRSDERAVRDERLRRTSVGGQVRELTLAEVGPAGLDVPPMVARRLKNLEGAKDRGSDAFELQQIYWDCVNILRWINRKERP